MLIQLLRHIPRAKFAFSAALFVFLLTVAGAGLTGLIYSTASAPELTEAVVPSVRTLSFAVITSTSTVLALMTTMLGFVNRVESEFTQDNYVRMRMISILSTIDLISATLVLVLISIPITEADNLQTAYQVVYWAIIIGSAWIAGILVAVIGLLYQALVSLIDALTPNIDLS